MDELPYFQFYYSQWITGKIQIADHTAKGIFIDICAYYWKNDCNLTVQDAEALIRPNKQCFSNAIAMLKEKKIIAIDKQDRIIIKFLDEQFQDRLDSHKKRVQSGRKGGLSKSSKQSLSNAKAKLKHIISYSNSSYVLNKGGTGEIDIKVPEKLNDPRIKKALLDWLEIMAIKGINITDSQLDLHFRDLLQMKDPEVILESINYTIKGQYKSFYLPREKQEEQNSDRETEQALKNLSIRGEL